MGVRGDFDGLADLRKRLASLQAVGFRRGATAVLGEAATKQLDDEFRQSRDPYGKAWAPLTSRTGQPLRDTGAHLQNGLSRKNDEHGFTVSTAFVGAAVHQYGATIRPVRAKALRFRTRGAPTKSRPRGRLSPYVYVQQVTIPRRQYMPEGSVGPVWGPALERAADDYVRSLVGV